MKGKVFIRKIGEIMKGLKSSSWINANDVPLSSAVSYAHLKGIYASYGLARWLVRLTALLTMLTMSTNAYCEVSDGKCISNKGDYLSMLHLIEEVDKKNETQNAIDVKEIVQKFIVPGCDIVPVITYLSSLNFELIYSNNQNNEVIAKFVLGNWIIGSSSLFIKFEYDSGKVRSFSAKILSKSI